MKPIYLFTIAALALALSATAQTNSPYRLVNGVVYDPAHSVKWVSVPVFGQQLEVVHVKTNGVAFSVMVTTLGGDLKWDGYIFAKHCPGKSEMYDGQKILLPAFRALPTGTEEMDARDGGKVTVRVYDAGEPCTLDGKILPP